MFIFSQKFWGRGVMTFGRCLWLFSINELSVPPDTGRFPIKCYIYVGIPCNIPSRSDYDVWLVPDLVNNISSP
jgi:hypothetical protein